MTFQLQVGITTLATALHLHFSLFLKFIVYVLHLDLWSILKLLLNKMWSWGLFFCIWLCNYWSLLIIPTALVGCLGASAGRTKGKEERKKQPQKTEKSTFSEHWELSPPARTRRTSSQPHCLLLALTPGLSYSSIRLSGYQRRNRWLSTNSSVILQTWYSSLISLPLFTPWRPQHKLNASNSGFIVVV